MLFFQIGADEPVSKRFSLYKAKDGANLSHRDTPRISRNEIVARGKD
jgi:hypothetical protein